MHVVWATEPPYAQWMQNRAGNCLRHLKDCILQPDDVRRRAEECLSAYRKDSKTSDNGHQSTVSLDPPSAGAAQTAGRSLPPHDNLTKSVYTKSLGSTETPTISALMRYLPSSGDEMSGFERCPEYSHNITKTVYNTYSPHMSCSNQPVWFAGDYGLFCTTAAVADSVRQSSMRLVYPQALIPLSTEVRIV